MYACMWKCLYVCKCVEVCMFNVYTNACECIYKCICCVLLSDSTPSFLLAVVVRRAPSAPQPQPYVSLSEVTNLQSDTATKFKRACQVASELELFFMKKYHFFPSTLVHRHGICSKGPFVPISM